MKLALARALVGGVCDQALSSVQDLMRNPGVDWNLDQCSEAAWAFKAGRVKGCLGTASSVCRAGAGFVALSEWPLLHSESQIVNMVEDIASLGLEGACLATGTSVLCGTINAALKQIAQTFATGTNDWVECSGIGQAALCLGQSIGAGGGLFSRGMINNQGIEMARIDPYREIVVRDCCYCDLAHYERHWWGGKEYAREAYLSVLLKGPFETGNCNYPGGKKQGSIFYDVDKHSGYYTFHRYEHCRKLTVNGNKCAVKRSPSVTPSEH